MAVSDFFPSFVLATFELQTFLVAGMLLKTAPLVFTVVNGVCGA
jgi:hypothetical protein